MSTTKYFNTTYELELLNQLNEMVSKKEDKKKIDKVKEQLVDYMIKLLAQLDLQPDPDAQAHEELIKGENIKLLEFLCTVDTPKLKRHYQQPDEKRDGKGYKIGGWYRLIWLEVRASDKVYAIGLQERIDPHEIRFQHIASSEDN